MTEMKQESKKQETDRLCCVCSCFVVNAGNFITKIKFIAPKDTNSRNARAENWQAIKITWKVWKSK